MKQINIKKVIARSVKDSRGGLTIQVTIKTSLGKFKTSAPSGKSRGRYEIRPYAKSLQSDIRIINNLNIEQINKIITKYANNEVLDIEKAFRVIGDIEKKVKNKIGANSLFALEASLLKALARENGKELWKVLEGKKENLKKIRSVGNVIGGGLHSKSVKGKKPDFQEFLFIANCKTFKECVRINKKAYQMIKRFLKSHQRDDEGAWETSFSNEKVLEIMKKVQEKIKKKYKQKIDIGLDVAGSSFYKNLKYVYKDPAQKLSKSEQIGYIRELIGRYKIFYIEDGLNENDFSGFRELNNKAKGCLIVGDDLTATNPKRLKKAIRKQAINGVVIKPNQIGSLLKVKEVIELAHKHKIKTIMSHRSGETDDDTIADLAVGWGCDFIKTGIYGKVRKAKLKRLIEIERKK